MELWILLGLVSTAIHGFSTVYSKRLYELAPHPSQVAFFCLFATGSMSLVIIPFVEFHDPSGHWFDILLVGSTFAAGHYAFVMANRYADASFVVPMMGLKVFFVALMAAIWLDETYGFWVYVGASGAFVGIVFLNDGKLKGSPVALFLVLGNCLLYALTDIFLIRLFRAGFGSLEVMVYLFAGAALFMVPIALVVLRGRWQMTRPFAKGLALFGVAQGGGGVLLMLTFALSQQAMMVNIIQSARGVFAVMAVYLMSRIGLKGLEVLNRKQYLSRSTGAGLIALSIVLALLAR
ncbi:MAG: DMT family transporter [Immundisolibacteraceae bacterium]|nr:DMT family transporter [Immundisolibacteraceae bacterium]